MDTFILILFLIITYFMVYFLVAPLMVRRAATRVIELFRASRAIDPLSAKYVEELSLQPRPFLSLHLTRDWKPQALSVLVKAGIVRTTAEGRLYLAENKALELELLGRISLRES